MKHNTCPHCGAHISFRQRFFTNKGEIHCAQCGGVSYLAPGVFWSTVNVTFFVLAMLVQHWFRQPAWIVAVVVVVIGVEMAALSPLCKLSGRARFWQIVVGAGVLLAYLLLSEWVLAHRPAVGVPPLPPTRHSAPGTVDAG
jgi:CXXC-20-CXXC protein